MQPRLALCSLLIATVASLFGLRTPGIAAPAAVQATSSSVNPGGTGGCLASIQAAVAASAAGDTITVAAGTYTESVTITKPLRLQGAGAGTTIIDATGADNAIHVLGTSGVTITGFTAENATLEGILLENASQVTVSNNTVENNDLGFKPPSAPGAMGTCPYLAVTPGDQADCGEGLHLNGVSDATIANNMVRNNQGGILVSDEAAATHDNWIVGNSVLTNLSTDCGITLASHPASIGPTGPVPGGGVYRNIVEGNLVMAAGGAGVGLFGSSPGTANYDNVITHNSLVNNGFPGVTLHIHTGDVDIHGEVITYNTISGNGKDPGSPSDGPAGIMIFSDDRGKAQPAVGITVAHNRISGEQYGIVVGTTAVDISLHFNDLAGTAVGVMNAGSGHVDAEWNYWGCDGGPGTASCAGVSGTVDHANPLADPPGSGA